MSRYRAYCDECGWQDKATSPEQNLAWASLEAHHKFFHPLRGGLLCENAVARGKFIRYEPPTFDKN